MSKNHQQHEQISIIELTLDAVRLAKQRRERELDERELNDVQGGLSVTLGYQEKVRVTNGFEL